MKVKTLIISAAFMVMAVGTGIGFYLYAKVQSADTDAARTEQVFKYFTSPPEESCTAYLYLVRNVNTGEETYMASVAEIDPIYAPNGYVYIFVESREGYLMDCVECPVRCSVYYELCDEYGVEY